MTHGNDEKGNPHKITEAWLEAWISRSADIKMDVLTYATNDRIYRVLVVHCSGMTGVKELHEYVYKELNAMQAHEVTFENLQNESNYVSNWKLVAHTNEIIQSILTGSTILYLPEEEVFFQVDTAAVPQRKTEESSSESSIKGARDGFTEALDMNIALIRKRLVTPSLCNESFTIGTRSQTKVSMLYLDDIAQPAIIAKARARLNSIQLDILSSSGLLEEALSDHPRSIFPLIDYIGRPDYAVDCLARGRFVVLVDGSPMALIAPNNLFEILKTPEDSYFPYYFVGFERLLRIIGLVISLFLPGFYVALTSFDTDQLPMQMLATAVNTRFGVPFSVPLETVIMLGMFELFREAGARLPKAIGQTVAVVGGLIIGDAAIRAGVTSPLVLVVSAGSAVATFTLVNQSLSGTVSVLRIVILLLACMFGMFGFFIGMMGILAYVCGLSSFQVPYLPTFSPMKFRETLKTLIALPKMAYKQRPEDLHTLDSSRQEEDST